MKKRNYIALKKVPDVVIELTGVPRSKAAVDSWVRRGRIGSDGSLVKLKAVKRMGRLYTTREWIENFVTAV